MGVKGWQIFLSKHISPHRCMGMPYLAYDRQTSGMPTRPSDGFQRRQIPQKPSVRLVDCNSRASSSYVDLTEEDAVCGTPPESYQELEPTDHAPWWA
jgi:hypothetical protein